MSALRILSEASQRAEPESTKTPLRTLLFERYAPDRGNLRDGAVEAILNAIALADAFAGHTVAAEELSHQWLVDFREWRLATRPVPVCLRHDPLFTEPHGPLRPSNGLWYRCPRRSCETRAIHVPPRAPATVNKDTRTLRGLWAFAVESGCNAQPLKRLKPLKVDLDDPICLTPEEVTRLLKACSARNDPFLPVPAADFYAALILAYYDCGPRISAIMETRPSDARFDADGTGTLSLGGSTQKQRKPQVLGLSAQTAAALAKIYDPGREWLFPWPYDRGPKGRRAWPALTARLKSILREAGLPAGRKDLWHKLRRTTATLITKELGIEAAREQLGHSSIKVTERYIDSRMLDQTKRASRVLPRP